MTRRTDTVPEEPPDYLTVDELAAILRISRNRAYELVRRGAATNGRDGIAAVRVDKQFRISRYVIEERLGGPLTWPIPGFHDVAGIEPATPSRRIRTKQRDVPSERQPSMPTRHTRSKSPDSKPSTQPRLFPL